MPADSHIYEYAVIRYVPRVEREEFINVGLIMMCKRKRWIRVAIRVPEQRIRMFDSAMSPDELLQQLSLFTAVAEKRSDAGPMTQLEPEERFRWLTAVKSACIQTSRPHPGLSTDLDADFDRLLAELVL